ncbi:MAG: ATP-binding cassette domain-containing protein [Gammaproteobacteria bacterium]|nr:ATP-binding cassette domain-containing protein [Gammaproteobacteria bacterium]
MLELRGVSKRFGDALALDNVSLGIAPHQTTALVGTSGCGKSTLLRIILHLVTPDSGEVRIDGQRQTRTEIPTTRRRCGYVTQSGGLFPHLTVHQNAALLAQHLRRDPAWIRQRSAELAARLHLEPPLLERLPRELSGGQRQRAALLRALMLAPDLLLLDEPLAALDPLTRHDLQAELKELFAELQATVVFVTHDLAEAAYLAPQLILMHAGRVLQEGSATALRERPADRYVRRFVAARRDF